MRPLQPLCEAATEEDCLELMEMILGALGRDAIGLGAGMAHPRESEEWQSMSLSDKCVSAPGKLFDAHDGGGC